jgi:hypothetical protein
MSMRGKRFVNVWHLPLEFQIGVSNRLMSTVTHHITLSRVTGDDWVKHRLIAQNPSTSVHRLVDSYRD